MKKARDKVQKFHLFEMKLKQLKRKSRSKDLADKTEKVKSELRKAREGLKQAEGYYNAINEKQKKYIEKLKDISS